MKKKEKWNLKGRTAKEYIREKIRPEVKADWERLWNSPAFTKKEK